MADTIISKRCTKCKVLKPLSGFYRARSHKDLHRSVCKECESAAESRRHRTPEGRARRREYWRRYARSTNGRAIIKARQALFQRTPRALALDAAAHRRYRRTDKGKAAMVRAHRRHPERVAARHAIKNAVRRKELPPPTDCTCKCGRQAAHYHHHHGYSPEHHLDVIPVCRKCHQVTPASARSDQGCVAYPPSAQ